MVGGNDLSVIVFSRLRWPGRIDIAKVFDAPEKRCARLGAEVDALDPERRGAELEAGHAAEIFGGHGQAAEAIRHLFHDERQGRVVRRTRRVAGDRASTTRQRPRWRRAAAAMARPFPEP